MKILRNKMLVLIFSIAMLAFPVVVFGQIDPREDPDAPIDGGIGLLIAAGAAYGYKRYKKSKSSDEVK